MIYSKAFLCDNHYLNVFNEFYKFIRCKKYLTFQKIYNKISEKHTRVISGTRRM